MTQDIQDSIAQNYVWNILAPFIDGTSLLL